MRKDGKKTGKGSGKTIPMDGAPTIQPEEIITKNPWRSFDEDEQSRRPDLDQGSEYELGPCTFSESRGYITINLQNYHLKLSFTERGAIVSQAHKWREVCTIGQVRAANLKRAKSAKKLKIKG